MSEKNQTMNAPWRCRECEREWLEMTMRERINLGELYALSFLVFICNAWGFVIFFELVLYQSYRPDKCDARQCYFDNFVNVHCYLLPVYFFLAFIYSAAFLRLSLDKEVRSDRYWMKWLLLFAIMAVSGLFIYSSVVYYRRAIRFHGMQDLLALLFQFIYEVGMTKFKGITGLLLLMTTLATVLYLKLRHYMMSLSASPDRSFFLATCVVSVLLFCSVTAEFDSFNTYNGDYGIGYGFPFIWKVKYTSKLSDAVLEEITLNKVIFDFLFYFLSVTFVLWLCQWFRFYKVLKVFNHRFVFWPLVTLTLIVLCFFVLKIDLSHDARRGLEFDPVPQSIKFYFGPV